MKPITKTSTSIGKQLARQMGPDERRADAERHRDEGKDAKVRESRSDDIVGKVFRRIHRVDGTVHVGIIVSRVGKEFVLVHLLDAATGMPMIDGVVLVKLAALCLDFTESAVGVTFYDDAVAYVAANRAGEKDQRALTAEPFGSDGHALND